MSAGAIAQRYGTVLRCYDNGGRSADRYTIIPPRWAGKDYREHAPGTWLALAASPSPFNPQGVGMHCAAMPGNHLGKRVKWSELPEDVRTFARQAFPEYAPEAQK